MVDKTHNEGPQVLNTGGIIVSDSKTSDDTPRKPWSLDEVLQHELGQFGRYQRNNLLLISVPIIMSAFIMEYVFSAMAIPHRCRISECGEYSQADDFRPSWILNAIPASNSIDGFQSCSRFVSQANGTLTSCPADLFTSATTDCNGEFVYARNNSVVYDFNLGCQEWLRALAGTLSSVGSLLVLPMIGYVSDKFGRRVALVVSVFNLGLLGVVKAFSVNYAMFLTLQLLHTMFSGGVFSSAYIFATEFAGPRYRVLTSVVCTSMFAVGQVVLGGVAWLVQPWRYMLLALYVPCFIIITYYWILEESVRWLLSKEKFDEAEKVLQKVAKTNKKHISEASMKGLMTPLSSPIDSEGNKDASILAMIWHSPVLLRRVMTTPVWWVTATFVYYGLSINATALSDTMYLNYILTCAIEIPGFFTAVLLLDRIGRKATLSSGFFFSAICNFAFAFIPRSYKIVRLTVYLLGKFSISMVFTSLYMYTSELYPTQYRHRLLAFSSMVGRVGSIIAPLTPVLMEYWHGIPSTMFATMAVVSGILVLTQPETLGTKMPDTLTEAENIGRSTS